jgi:hypothetical protein
MSLSVLAMSRGRWSRDGVARIKNNAYSKHQGLQQTMRTVINNLTSRTISPGDVRSDGSLTVPRSFGVYELPHSAPGTRRFRLGNYPVRLHELERDFGSCKLLYLFREREDAVAMASVLNGDER